jgi:hypothetical protein
LVDFEILELLLKHMPNLTIFRIHAELNKDMVSANRWQYLIQSSLPHLRVFNFYFSFLSRNCNNDTLNIFQQFQTNFWCEKHHWYTNYEMTDIIASIYTMPYLRNEYTLQPTVKRYANSNQFDNVTKLFVVIESIKDDVPYYFNNVKSLIFREGLISNDHEGPDEVKLQKIQIKYLNKIVNLTNIKHLELLYTSSMLSSSLLLILLKQLPHVSSLGIAKDVLLPYLKNRQLRKYLNRKINTLDIIYGYLGRWPINSFEVELICKTFSNLEQLHGCILELDDLLSILEQCSKLSMINIPRISKHIYSWIQINASKLNVHIDFDSIRD